MKNLLIPLILVVPSIGQSQPISLSITDPVPSTTYDWGSGSIWDNGVPGASDAVRMGAQMSEAEEPLPQRVNVQIGAPVTVQSLSMDYEVFLTVSNSSLNVTGLLDSDLTPLGASGAGVASPVLESFRSQVTAGQMGGYNTLSGQLQTNITLTANSYGGGIAFIQWPGADVRHLLSGINLLGPNSKLQDPSGLNALRNLSRIGGGGVGSSGFLNLQAHTLNISGNLINDVGGDIIMGLGAVLNVGGTISGGGRYSKTDGGARITAGGFTATGVDFEMADSLTPDFELEAPLINLTNAKLKGSGKLKGNVTLNNTDIEGRSGGGRIDVTGTSGIIVVDSRLKQPTSGVDSFQLKALTQQYNSTSTAGNWTLSGTISYTGGSIRPGNSPGTLKVEEGDFTLAGPVLLAMELGGRTPGTGHDVIIQSGGPNGTTLAGTLQLTFIDRFECEVLTTESFTILTSDRPLMGAFTNVASGARLTTTDGSGSFLVSYGAGAPAPNAVTLSDFQPVIVPETYTQWVTRLAIPSGHTGPNDDPNGDGISNAVAFATGLSPVGPGQPSPIASQMTPTGLVLSFLSPKSALGLTVTSASSTDLSAWPAGPALTAVPATALKNRYSFTLPLTGSDRRFGRFNITVTP